MVLSASGTILEQQRYMPFGAPRTLPPYDSVTSTDFTYTGQRDITGTGLMDYKARFYSPYINRFLQPDSIIPDMFNPQSLNRYSYVLNNPIRYTDPTGHEACIEESSPGNCIHNYLTYYKQQIKKDYGVTLSKGDKEWDVRDSMIVYASLNKTNDVLKGELKRFTQGWTFKRYTQDSGYHGNTSTDGTKIVSFFSDNRAIVQQNIFHEVGHVLDNTPGMEDFFSHHSGINNADFLDKYGKLDTNALIYSQPDMYQHETSVFSPFVKDEDKPYAQAEHWADMFANYVAGNINLGSPEGRAMIRFVANSLGEVLRPKALPYK